MDPFSGENSADTSTLIAPARKLVHEILRRIAKVKNGPVAQAIGKDESTVSRIASEETGIRLSDLEPFLRSIGLKVVDRQQVCVDREVYKSWRTLAVTAITEPDKLKWDE